MTPSEFHPDRDEAARIDLLVDGALSDSDRRELLSSLDGSPGGWRRCALAFLEAQAWREAFAETEQVGSLPCPSAIAAPRPTRHFGPWLAAAAALLAFGAGWTARPTGISPSIAAVPRTPTPPAPSLVPVPPAPIVSRIDPGRPAPPNYARGRLEREGYRVEQTRLVVPAKTKDGRPVAVPVQRTTIRYVGNRSV